jgi:hypothetical protein
MGEAFALGAIGAFLVALVLVFADPTPEMRQLLTISIELSLGLLTLGFSFVVVGEHFSVPDRRAENQNPPQGSSRYPRVAELVCLGSVNFTS